MKQTSKTQYRPGPILTGLALVGSASFCLAVGPITQDFNSGAGSVTDFGIDFGTGTVAWGATNGVGGSGCLVVKLDASNAANKEIAAKWTVTGGPFRTSDYLQVEYDLRIDTASGADAGGSIGNYQEVFRDAGGSWEGHWIGAIAPGQYSDWVHMTVAVPNNGKMYPTFDWVLQGSAPYSTDVVFYVDNIVISPVPNPYLWLDFAADANGWSQEGWTTVAGTATWNNSEGYPNPTGCLQLDSPFSTTQGQQSWFVHSTGWTPSRWSFIEFDIKVDAANSTPLGDGTYGGINLDIRKPGWADNILTGPTLDSTFTSWQHVKLPLPVQDAGPAMDIIFPWTTHTGSLRVYVDNIKMSTPITPPRISALQPGTPGGVKIFVDGNGSNNIYDEEAISAPAADNTTRNFFWLNQTPASYSFTINHFPSPTDAPGFMAHIYIINGDTLTANGQNFGYNTTYSGCTWNAQDAIALKIQNGTSGGVVAALEWKTNLPNANMPNRTQFTPSYTSVNGTWTVNFPDSTHAVIVGPDGATVGSVDLPDFQTDPTYVGNFTPVTSCIQFGLSKNGRTENNDRSAYFNHVVVTNVSGVIYDDNFSGPGLTAHYAWQVAQYWQYFANRVLWQPEGTAFWLVYGEPSAGYTVRSAGSILGPWADAGVTYVYTDTTGTNHFAAIPTASLPPGNSGFFRLFKP